MGSKQPQWALVLDLSQMRRIIFNKPGRSVEIEGGVTTGMLLDTLPPDVVLPTTVNRNVGLIGAALGGGYGMLCGSYGLTCDALISAVLVTPLGDLLHVSANEHSDLFRAIRGGGSGYGVITSASFRTYDCAGVLAARLIYPLDKAIEALLRTQELLEAHPVQLGICPVFIHMPDGGPQLILNVVWNSSEQNGRTVLECLNSPEGATPQEAAYVPFRETLDDGAIWPWGRSWALETRNFDRLSPELCQELVEAARSMPSPGNILFLHDFHGYAVETPATADTFPLRQNHFVACACASWSADDEDAFRKEQQDWVASVEVRLAPLALSGGYINFLSPGAVGRVHEVYGSAVDGLQSLKCKYDPQDLLRYATGRL